MPALHKGEQL